MNMSGTIQGIRTGALGLPSVRDAWTSLHHLDKWDVWKTFVGKLPDQSTMVFDRTEERGVTSFPTLSRGNLAPGIYEYVVLAHEYTLGAYSRRADITVDVRHWGSPSSLAIEWRRIGNQSMTNSSFSAGEDNDFRYDVYRRHNAGLWGRLIRTRDNKIIDQGTPLNLGEGLTQARMDETRFMEPFHIRAGRNAFVRTLGHVTDQNIVIYLDNTRPLADWEKQTLECMMDELVPAPVRWTWLALNRFE